MPEPCAVYCTVLNRNYTKWGATPTPLARAGIQYDPEWNKEYWLTRPVTVVSRLIRIGAPPLPPHTCIIVKTSTQHVILLLLSGSKRVAQWTKPKKTFHRCAGVAFARWLAYRRLNGEEAAARAMTDTLTDLGPAFVKIGQAVASRPDIVPPLYLSKLESLQVHCCLAFRARFPALFPPLACGLLCESTLCPLERSGGVTLPVSVP